MFILLGMSEFLILSILPYNVYVITSDIELFPVPFSPIIRFNDELFVKGISVKMFE